MALKVTYLSVGISIGGKKIVLKAEMPDPKALNEGPARNALAAAKKALEDKIQENQGVKDAKADLKTARTTLDNAKTALDAEPTDKTKKKAFDDASDDLKTKETAYETAATAAKETEPVKAEQTKVDGLVEKAQEEAKKAAEDAGKSLSTRMKEGMAFKTAPEDVFACTFGDIYRWFKNVIGSGNKKLASTGEKALPTPEIPEVLGEMTGKKGKLEEVLDGIGIEVWNLSLSTNFDFTANFQLSFDKKFYDALGVPSAITDVFSLDSLGIGIAYTREKTEDKK